jgi:general secretion pathway protein G
MIKKSQRGVTLIEMLVVVTIIALFASVVGIRYFAHVGQAKRIAAISQIERFETALGVYKLSTGTFPTNEQGLLALCQNPGIANWNGPYLAKDLPLDPWGQPYLYRHPGEHSPDPEIVSYGADGKSGGTGEDADVANWKTN